MHYSHTYAFFFSSTVPAPWKPTAAFQRENAEAHNWQTDSWTIDTWRNVKNVTLETSSLEFSRSSKQSHCITLCSYTLAVVGGGRNCSFTVSAGYLSPHTTQRAPLGSHFPLLCWTPGLQNSQLLNSDFESEEQGNGNLFGDNVAILAFFCSVFLEQQADQLLTSP